MSLAAHLRDQHDRLEQLIGLLTRERDLLGEGTIDGEALGALAAEKQQVLDALADGEDRRRAVHAGHGYSVDAASLPAEVEITHTNLNDGTVEGLAHRTLPVWSVQWHPEAHPGPGDTDHLFDRFLSRAEVRCAA